MPDPHLDLVRRLATTLARLQETEPLSVRLCEAGRRLLDADGASLTLRLPVGATFVAAATDDVVRRLEDVQEVVGEGPSRDAVDLDVVQVLALPPSERRWPMLVEHARGLDLQGELVALPLRAPGAVVGALTAYRRSGGRSFDGPTAEFLSVTLGAGVLQDPHLVDRPGPSPAEWAAQARLHQATGMIVSQIAVRPDDALALLRGRAFVEGSTLEEMADHVIERRVSFRDTTTDGD